MKLYTTPPSILTLVTWVPQNRQGTTTPHSEGAPHPLCSNGADNSCDLGTVETMLSKGLPRNYYLVSTSVLQQLQLFKFPQYWCLVCLQLAARIKDSAVKSFHENHIMGAIIMDGPKKWYFLCYSRMPRPILTLTSKAHRQIIKILPWMCWGLIQKKHFWSIFFNQKCLHNILIFLPN